MIYISGLLVKLKNLALLLWMVEAEDVRERKSRRPIETKLSTVINRPAIDDANCYSWLRTVRIDQFMLTALKTVSSFFRNASI